MSYYNSIYCRIIPLLCSLDKQSKTSKDWDGMRNSKPHHLSSDRSQISCNFMFLHFGLKRVQFVCQSRKDIQIRTYLNSYYTDFCGIRGTNTCTLQAKGTKLDKPVFNYILYENSHATVTYTYILRKQFRFS